jgi:hypothetical protein
MISYAMEDRRSEGNLHVTSLHDKSRFPRV